MVALYGQRALLAPYNPMVKEQSQLPTTLQPKDSFGFLQLYGQRKVLAPYNPIAK